jgi:hypothetical protein
MTPEAAFESTPNESTKAMNGKGQRKMTVGITKTPFNCELITIHSKRSFANLISRIEAKFQYYDLKTLRDLTAAADREKLAAYVTQVGEPTQFAIFFSLDQGSTQRLAGIPIESRFYLFGKRDDRARPIPIFCTRRSWSAGALLRLTKRWRRCAHRH